MEYTEMLEKQVDQLRKANETDYAAYMHTQAQVERLRNALVECSDRWADLGAIIRENGPYSNHAYCDATARRFRAIATTEPERKEP